MLRSANFLLILLIPALFSCKNDPEPSNTTTNTTGKDTIYYDPPGKEGAVKYTVTSGIVSWWGKKSSGDTHEGTINVSSGELLVNRGILVSGEIKIDMHSLAVTSIKDGGEKRDLESHLKDTDFFEANKFPVAGFSFNEVLPSNTQGFNQVIVGDLTMKDKTNSVNVPVQLKISEKNLEARSPTFSINRTRWGISFRSGLTGTVKDKLIEDTVLLSIRLTAKSGGK